MSAPAGWHLQPDGRERYWDGQEWTEQFRMPYPSDPTASPEWTTPSQDTQVLDVSHTTAIPSPQQQQPYPQPGHPQPDPQEAAAAGTGYGAQQGYGSQPGYGAPPSGYGAAQQGYPAQQPGYPAYGAPPPQRGSGAAKGCLIAALVGLVVLVIFVAGGIFFFARTVDQVTEPFPTTFPSEIPTTLPSEIPTNGGSLDIEISVGEGFELPRGQIEDGWTIESGGAGPLDAMTIAGMRAVPSEDDGFPLLFTMAFEVDDTTTVDTVCTAPGGTAGTPVDVSCVPLFGDVENVRQVRVTATL